MHFPLTSLSKKSRSNPSNNLCTRNFSPLPSYDSQVKGLSIEQEKLAVAQSHAAENSTSADARGGGDGGGGSGGGGGGAGGSVDSGVSGTIGAGGIGNGGGSSGGGVGEVSDLSEASEASTMVRNVRRALTPAPSPAPAHTVPNVYSTSHYYDKLNVDTLKRLKR